MSVACWWTLVSSAPCLAAADSTAARPTLAISSRTSSWEDLCLGRAAMEQSLGHLDGVIRNLEGIDFASPSFAEADRAAFLLGQAYLEVGATTRFAALVRAVSRWTRPSPYTQWLALQLRIAEAEGTAATATVSRDASGADTTATDSSRALERIGFGAADALAASLRLREGDLEGARRFLASAGAEAPSAALEAYVEVLALVAAGQDDEAALARLAGADTASVLGRDLAGLALVRRAAHAAARGEDPRPLLAAVPNDSRFTARARHMAGLASLERGDLEGGRRMLDSLQTADSTYEGRREVMLVLAGRALDEAQWATAHERYAAVDRDWVQNRDALHDAQATDRVDSLWAQWEANVEGSDALMLDALPARMLAEQLARASADLRGRPAMTPPALLAPRSVTPPRWTVAPPSAEEWRAVAGARARAREAGDEVERADRATRDERARLEDLRRYLGLGLDHARGEQTAIEGRVAHLDSLEGMLRGIDAQLQAVAEETKRRIAARAAEILRLAEIQRCWVLAMRHFYVEGPNQARESAGPFGYPSPDSLTREERALTEGIQQFVERLAAGTPDLVDRSYQHAWRPHVIDIAVTNREEAHRLLAWARRLGPAIAAAVDSAVSSPTLLALQAGAARRAVTHDSLVTVQRTLATRVADSALARALAALEREREGIDYGLAVSAYGASVRLTPGTDSTATAQAANVGAPGDSATAAGSDEESDDPQTATWRAQAIASLHGFLERHPSSAARGEMRFRLADLLLVDARQGFRARMAEFVRNQESGIATGALPVMDPAPALALYRTILEEDPGFERLDAVLFNAAMLLADQGDGAAAGFFERLVRDYPASSYVQESYLRMGDLKFNDKSFAECVPLYEHAAAGSDLSLRAIALYKLGWAHFNGERLSEAADAFRAVLDVYEAKRDLKLSVDIEGEAEAYLIHTLARSGGAEAFAAHFDSVGARPYERRVLRGLAHHFRRYSLFGEAAAAEEMYLSRYPLEADALASAQRLPETYERWDHVELARKARLDYAPRFAPGSDWYAAQSSDSVKSAGVAFARSSWLSVALEHHRAAREKGAREDWSEALRLYRTVLEHWPQDSLAASYQLYAGEASQHLGDYPGALEYYAQAAAAGADSVARQAMFQRVAVTDAWYESTRVKAERGRDSLAQAVLAAGDQMLARFPDHAAGADVSWRMGNLGFAHGWFERAGKDFERLMTQAPKDGRVPTAAALRADGLFRMNDFEAAGAAFEVAQRVAHEAGRDSLERRATAAIPVCYFRAAEALAATDSSAHAKQAALFEQVAVRWPQFEHAHVAQYRAGLAYFQAGKTREGVRAMEALIRGFPRSEYVKDAHLQIPKAWEAHGQPIEAATAYVAFARRFPADSSAGAAWLKAADLLAGAGQDARADELRLAYVRQHPEDVETAMEIFERLARRDLARVGPERPISTLLPPEKPVTAKRPAKGVAKGVAKGAAKAAAPDTTPAASYLAEYLRRGKARPNLISKGLLAQVRYLQGEEARASYLAARLGQPLEKSIPVKQKLLDSTLVRYRASVDLGVSEWADASAYRIGETLVAFGEALERSERPADLQGEDLKAYEDVILEQSQTFYDRGEEVWSDLLRERGKDAAPDAWVAKAQEALWQRLGSRFYFRPEADFPLMAGTPPQPERRERARSKAAPADSGKKSNVRAQREDQQP